MLFIKLTPEQKKLKKLEQEVNEYKEVQDQINKNTVNTFESTREVLKALFHRIVMLEHNDDTPTTLN